MGPRGVQAALARQTPEIQRKVMERVMAPRPAPAPPCCTTVPCICYAESDDSCAECGNDVCPCPRCGAAECTCIACHDCGEYDDPEMVEVVGYGELILICHACAASREEYIADRRVDEWREEGRY